MIGEEAPVFRGLFVCGEVVRGFLNTLRGFPEEMTIMVILTRMVILEVHNDKLGSSGGEG